MTFYMNQNSAFSKGKVSSLVPKGNVFVRSGELMSKLN